MVARAGAAVLRTRWLMRAPVWVFRAGLGPVLGSRLLMLEHIGRKSGTKRYVVLEVIDRPAAGSFVVASGFGGRSQWFQNVAACPDVRVWAGKRRGVRATAKQLGPSDASDVLRRYAAEKPRSWAFLHPMLEDTLGAEIDEQAPAIPMVRFDCHDEG